MRKCGAVPYEGDEKYIFVSQSRGIVQTRILNWKT